MKILIAPDKFKGSLSAEEVCLAIGKGIRGANKDIETIFHPMADGGDGSIAVLSRHLKFEKHEVNTSDPLGRPIQVPYFTHGESAFVELATASGYALLKQQEMNPLITSTAGTGKLILDAISKGYKHIYLFLGGSSTNDAGIGIAAALGYHFLDRNEQPLKAIGQNLASIQYIKPGTLFNSQQIQITLLCDVSNPLYGPNGAAYVYAPQKGASAEDVKFLDDGLRHFSQVVKDQLGVDISELPGGGAAGGIGAGLSALLNADIQAGFPTLSKLTKLEEQIKAADLVISGEGRLDAQSLQGKVISGMAQLCKKHNKPFVVFTGKNDLSSEKAKVLNIRQIFSVMEQAKDLQDAMGNGRDYLVKMAKRLVVQGISR